jgi:hypothetical protein
MNGANEADFPSIAYCQPSITRGSLGRWRYGCDLHRPM